FLAVRDGAGAAFPRAPGAGRGVVGGGRLDRLSDDDPPHARPGPRPRGTMNGRARLFVFFPAAAGLGVLLVWAFLGLPRFGFYHGPYGTVLRAVAVHQRHATNVVNAIVFDYRGFDTVGEEFIFFAAVIGIATLLRAQRAEAEGRAEDHARHRQVTPTSDAVRVASLLLVG